MGVMRGSKKLKGCRVGSRKVKKIMHRGQKIWSAGSIVTYVVDAGVSYQEEVDEGVSCLTPKTFTPTKEGWTFVGWSAEPGGTALTSKIMEDSPITLYAVWIGNPHCFTPLNQVTWTKGNSQAGGDKNKLEVYTDRIVCKCLATNEGAWRHCNAKASIPTYGCQKVRLKIYNNGASQGSAKVFINGTDQAISIAGNTDKTYNFSTGGQTNVTIQIQTICPSPDLDSEIRLYEIYFYN